jgi:hypothetical protein
MAATRLDEPASAAADGNLNNQIDPDDLNIWRANFGNTAGSGSTAALPTDTAVPEPVSLMLVLFGVVLTRLVLSGRRRSA